MNGIRQQNITVTGYFYLALLLFAYVVWRSIAVSFTHDECLSYTIITGNDHQVYTANNHWLNTILMFLSSRIFGYSELALRLPNVLVFGMYLLFIYKIFREYCESPIALYIAAPLLLFNPFILDFFGLARGYGLGIAFFTASVYYFLAFFQQKQSVKNMVWLVATSVCCVYANYAFLTAILALHGAALLAWLRAHREKPLQLLLFYVIEILLFVPAILNILYLSEKNELYVGGDRDVFHDTLKSIISFSFSYGEDPYGITAIASIVLAVAFIGGFFFFKSRIFNWMKLIIFFLLLIPTVLHAAIGMKFPKDRAAVYWMVMAGFFLMFATDTILKKLRTHRAGGSPSKWRKALLVPILIFAFADILQLANFVPNFNCTYTIIWSYDADVKAAINLVEGKVPTGKKISIGCSWLVEPPLNYYRETRKLDWFPPIPKEIVIAGKHDFYLVFKDDLPNLEDRKLLKVKYYHASGLYVMKASN